MMSEVPTLAITVVEIEFNNTVLNDEFIIQRLGLIPIISKEVDKFEAWWEENDDDDDDDDEGPPFEVKFTLSKFCDSSEETLVVTSNDLEIDEVNFPDVKPINYRTQSKPIVIVKMSEGQAIRLHCFVRKGIGKLHAQYNPCATAVFRIPPLIHINNNLLSKLTLAQKRDLVASCPTKDIFSLNPDSNEIEVEANELHRYTYDDEIVRKAESFGIFGAILIREKPHHFNFTVEATGSLHPWDIVLNALGALKKKLHTLNEETEQILRTYDAPDDYQMQYN